NRVAGSLVLSQLPGVNGKAYPISPSLCRRYIESPPITKNSHQYLNDPTRLLGARAIVLKSPGEQEKGVLLMHYSFIFPLFAKLFDVTDIAQKSYFILEPSWSGYCEMDILCYTQFAMPVFVEAYEPRDRDFVLRSPSNLIPVGTASNWWVD